MSYDDDGVGILTVVGEGQGGRTASAMLSTTVKPPALVEKMERDMPSPKVSGPNWRGGRRRFFYRFP